MMALARRLGALIVGCTLVGLAACSSGGGSAPSSSNRPFAAYRQCLEQHGVTPRHPAAGPGNSTSTTGPPDVAAFAAARQACGKLRPAGGLRGGGIASKARTAFQHCMASHGVTLPGPASRTSSTGTSTGTGPDAGAGGTPPRGGMLAGLDRHDPTVAKALAACRSRLGTPATSTSTTR